MHDAHVLRVLVLVGTAVVTLNWLGRRLGVAAPIVLLSGGVR